ncbi:unnamed protein product [Protopolystoma xenopodis]|uniref:Uncharacterized protein n=1 Tax=Protopolystoma xenopodis TaxID=117903 RepID=A0A448XIN1_9PLAT|nr:unnamed protein product [Protopolystoma xenopodis]
MEALTPQTENILGHLQLQSELACSKLAGLVKKTAALDAPTTSVEPVAASESPSIKSDWDACSQDQASRVISTINSLIGIQVSPIAYQTSQHPNALVHREQADRMRSLQVRLRNTLDRLDSKLEARDRLVRATDELSQWILGAEKRFSQLTRVWISSRSSAPMQHGPLKISQPIGQGDRDEQALRKYSPLSCSLNQSVKKIKQQKF